MKATGHETKYFKVRTQVLEKFAAGKKRCKAAGLPLDDGDSDSSSDSSSGDLAKKKARKDEKRNKKAAKAAEEKKRLAELDKKKAAEENAAVQDAKEKLKVDKARSDEVKHGRMHRIQVAPSRASDILACGSEEFSDFGTGSFPSDQPS